MPNAITKLEAYELIESHGSHGNLGVKEIAMIAEAFGVKLRANKQIANKADRAGKLTNPKGLHIEGKPLNYELLSLGGWEIAEQLAYKLGLTWDASKLGRGFRYREAMQAIALHQFVKTEQEKAK